MSEPSVAVVGQGVKRTVLNGVPYDYRAGQYLVVSVDLPVIGQALEASQDESLQRGGGECGMQAVAGR